MAIRIPSTRWRGDGKRPGVEARRVSGRGNWNHSDARYIVVTAQCRSEHDTFAEAVEEYRIRRADLTGIGGKVGA